MNVDKLIQRVKKTFFAKSICDDIVAALRLLQWHEEKRGELRRCMVSGEWSTHSRTSDFWVEMCDLWSKQEKSKPDNQRQPSPDRQDWRWMW